MSDLPAIHMDLAASLRGITAAERAWLVKRGVMCPMIGCCGARADAAQWVPDTEAPKAFIFPVLDVGHVCTLSGPNLSKIQPHTPTNIAPFSSIGDACQIVDLAAWRPSAPGTVLLREGSVHALGEWTLQPRERESPLNLYSTPLAWAAANFDGAVIVDWDAAVFDLIHCRHIATDTLDLAETLTGGLQRERKRLTPKKPEVGVIAV